MPSSQALGLSASPRSSDHSDSSSEDASPVDPFEAASQEEDEEPEDEELLRNTRENSTASALYSHVDAKNPSNPLQRSLVNREDSFGAMSGERIKSVVQPMPTGKPGLGTPRASMDVDAFKRLLMTGNKGPGASGSPPTPPAQTLLQQSFQGDNSSSTDTSSISRQSIFEFVSEPASDTPRTSHEISNSDDERQQLVGQSTHLNGRKKPQPTRGRHGGVLKSSTPQTVSFLDPSLSVPISEKPPATTAVQATRMIQQLPKTLTDLNKPLPPPPVSPYFAQSSGVQQGSFELVESPNNSRSTSPSGTSQKRRPPTPPLARRHSLLRTFKPSLSRTNSARLPVRSSDGFSGSVPSADVKAPPPPPTRRTTIGPGQSSFESSMEPITVLGDNSTSVNNPALSVKLNISNAPPPPPTRTPSISSIKRPHRASRSSPSAAVPPPVPPPRNRGSSQSSFDSSRLNMSSTPSVDRFGVETRRSSMGSRRKVSDASSVDSSAIVASNPAGGANDILANLSLLQKEVDDLRGKYDNKTASQSGREST